MEKKEIIINKHKIQLSNVDKIFFPKSGYTKGDVINYYQKIANYMLPHVKDRPLVMQRFPDGITSEGFFNKEMPDYFPSWIKHKMVTLATKKKQSLVVIQKKEDIVYLANQGVLVFHVWLSNVDAINKPNKIIFDLDPSKGADFEDIKFAAYKIKEFFEDSKLTTFVMTTGSRGVHVIIPIKPEHIFDKVRNYVKEVAATLSAKYPDKLTNEVRKKERKGRVFLDFFRNSFGQTGVAPYSLRAIEKAPLATPITWDELSSLKTSQKYNVKNIFKRLMQKDDAWKNFFSKAKSLKI